LEEILQFRKRIKLKKKMGIELIILVLLLIVAGFIGVGYYAKRKRNERGDNSAPE
jgi:uncharacterized membrane protein